MSHKDLESCEFDVLTCSLCEERYDRGERQARILHAGHSFCNHCLNAWIEKCNKENTPFQCPVCNVDLPTPTTTKEYPLDVNVHILLEEIEANRPGRKFFRCGLCTEDEDARIYCTETGLFLCSLHELQFRKGLKTKDNVLISLEEAVAQGKMLTQAPRCALHDKPLEFYCTTIKTPICKKCSLIDPFRGYAREPIEVTFKNNEADMRDLITHARDEITGFKEGLKAIVKDHRMIVADEAAAYDACNAYFNRMEQVLAKRRKILLAEIQAVTKSKVQALDIQHHSLSVTVSSLASCADQMEKLLANRATVRAVQLAGQLRNTVMSIVEEQKNWEPNAHPGLCFVSDPKLESLNSSAARNFDKNPLLKKEMRVKVKVAETQLFVTGGWDTSRNQNTCELYDPITDKWTEGVPMAYRRQAHAVAVGDGLVYAMGGWDGRQVLLVTECFHPKTNSWSSLANMSMPRQSLGACNIDRYIYAIGGHNGQDALDAVERLDPAINQWKPMASMNSKRSQVAVVSHDGYAYALGGFDGKNILNTCERYDPKTDSWSVIASMGAKRAAAAAAVLNNLIYIFGGRDNKSSVNSVEVYDPISNTWSPVCPMYYSRSKISAAVIGQHIYVSGGFDSSAVCYCEQYDHETNTWFTVTSMKVKRDSLAMCSI